MKNDGKIYVYKGVKWLEVGNRSRPPKERFVPVCIKCGITELYLKSVPYQRYLQYYCAKCEKYCDIFGIDDIKRDLALIVQSDENKDASVINIDDTLIPITRVSVKDDDYWVDAKISKNKKGESQVMVLAGSRKSDHKSQLFLEPLKEKMSFDQNNSHPNEIFAKVEGTFKKSNTKLSKKKGI